MSQTLHPPIRLHTRFIKTLKIIQYAGYLIVGLFGVLSIGFSLYPSFVTPGEGKMNASFFRVVVTRK